MPPPGLVIHQKDIQGLEAVVLMVVVYCSGMIQTKNSKEKMCMGGIQEKAFTSFQISSFSKYT